jgi:hypothetical protein
LFYCMILLITYYARFSVVDLLLCVIYFSV